MNTHTRDGEKRLFVWEMGVILTFILAKLGDLGFEGSRHLIHSNSISLLCLSEFVYLGMIFLNFISFHFHILHPSSRSSPVAVAVATLAALPCSVGSGWMNSNVSLMLLLNIMACRRHGCFFYMYIKIYIL